MSWVNRATRAERQTTALTALLLLLSSAPLSAQAVSVHADAGAVRVKAPGFHFIHGDLLGRVKDGHTVRVDLELAVLPRAGAEPVARNRQTFLLSYDLWEERLAVAQAGASAPAITHLTATAAEAWCLDRVGVPLTEIGPLGRDAPFWIRLEYRVLDDNAATPADEDNGGFTLRGLIEALSRRPSAGGATHAIEAGPFRLSG